MRQFCVPRAIFYLSMGILGLGLSGSTATAGGLNAQLRELETKEALKELLAPTGADEANAQALMNLARDLAAGLLVPRAELGKGRFGDTIKEGQARFLVPLTFSSSPKLGARVGALGKALGATGTAPNTVCFVGPGGIAQRIRVSPAAEEILLQALSVSDITPIPMLRAQVDGRVFVLSGARIGGYLFNRIAALVSSGSQDVTLSLTPIPEWQPVRLSLTTTEGQRVTIPVELDGADRKLTVDGETRWTLNGADTGVLFDSGQLGQIVLLAEVMRTGNLTLSRLARSDHFPVAEIVLPETIEHSFHILGANSAWFTTVNHKIEPKMRVRHTSGECSLRVEFSSVDDAAEADLGWMPLSIWNDVTGVKTTVPGQVEAVVGYLSKPRCASDAGSLSAEEFDRVMRLPNTCSTLCKRVARAGKSFVTQGVGEGGKKIMERYPALSFSMRGCSVACVNTSEYRDCLVKYVRGSQKRRYLGLEHCENRRKAR